MIIETKAKKKKNSYLPSFFTNLTAILGTGGEGFLVIIIAII